VRVVLAQHFEGINVFVIEAILELILTAGSDAT
jgi:hypothetical protein